MTTQTSAANAIPFLFDRPGEPLLTGRDDVSFDVPENFWVRQSQILLSWWLFQSNISIFKMSFPAGPL